MLKPTQTALLQIVPQRATVDSIQEYGSAIRWEKQKPQAFWPKLRWNAGYFFASTLSVFFYVTNAIGAGSAMYWTLSTLGLPLELCAIQLGVAAYQNVSNYNRSVRRTTQGWFGYHDDDLVTAAYAIPDVLEKTIDAKVAPWYKNPTSYRNGAWYAVSFFGAILKAAIGAIGIMTALEKWVPDMAGYSVYSPLFWVKCAAGLAVFVGASVCNISQQGNELRKNQIKRGFFKASLLRMSERLLEYFDVLHALQQATLADLNSLSTPRASAWQRFLDIFRTKAQREAKRQARQAAFEAAQVGPTYSSVIRLQLAFWQALKKEKAEELEKVYQAEYEKERREKAHEALLLTMRARDTLSYEWSRMQKISAEFAYAKEILKAIEIEDDAVAEKAAAANKAREEAAAKEGKAAAKKETLERADYHFETETSTFLSLFGVKRQDYLKRSFGQKLKKLGIKAKRFLLSDAVLYPLAAIFLLGVSGLAAYFLWPVFAGMLAQALVAPITLAAASLIMLGVFYIGALGYEWANGTRGTAIFKLPLMRDRFFELRHGLEPVISVSNATSASLDAWFSFGGVVAFGIACATGVSSVVAMTTAMASPLIVGLCALIIPCMYLMNYYMYKQKIKKLFERHRRAYDIRKKQKQGENSIALAASSSDLNKRSSTNQPVYNKNPLADNLHRAEQIKDEQPLFAKLKNWATIGFININGGFFKAVKTSLGSYGTWVNVLKLVGVVAVAGVMVSQPVGLASIGIAIAISLFVCAVVVIMAQISPRVKSSNISMSATKASLVALVERAPDERVAAGYVEALQNFRDGRRDFMAGLQEIVEELLFEHGPKVKDAQVKDAKVEKSKVEGVRIIFTEKQNVRMDADLDRLITKYVNSRFHLNEDTADRTKKRIALKQAAKSVIQFNFMYGKEAYHEKAYREEESKIVTDFNEACEQYLKAYNESLKKDKEKDSIKKWITELQDIASKLELSHEQKCEEKTGVVVFSEEQEKIIKNQLNTLLREKELQCDEEVMAIPQVVKQRKALKEAAISIVRLYCSEHPDNDHSPFNRAYKAYIAGLSKPKLSKQDRIAIQKNIEWISAFEKKVYSARRENERLFFEPAVTPVPEAVSVLAETPQEDRSLMRVMLQSKDNLHLIYQKQIEALIEQRTMDLNKENEAEKITIKKDLARYNQLQQEYQDFRFLSRIHYHLEVRRSDSKKETEFYRIEEKIKKKMGAQLETQLSINTSNPNDIFSHYLNEFDDANNLDTIQERFHSLQNMILKTERANPLLTADDALNTYRKNWLNTLRRQYGIKDDSLGIDNAPAPVTSPVQAYS